MPVEVLTLQFKLLSAATFGRGDGLPGLVDQEIEHDLYGLPFLRGRTLRGLLAEEMESLLYVLPNGSATQWQKAKQRLLGSAGRMTDETGIMHVGDACLPERLHRLIAASVSEQEGKITRETVLNALTAIRRQTAMTHLGAPEPASLRAMRVVLRGTVFASQFTFDQQLEPLDKALLAATTLAWRRVGIGRNRGRGRVKAWLEHDEWMREQFALFQREVTGQ